MNSLALAELHFSAHYKRGAILKFLMKADDPAIQFRFKFAVVLNKDPLSPEVLLALTTSRTARFSSGWAEDDIFRIPVGTYPCFDLPTVLSLREIRQEPLTELVRLCALGKMNFEGHLSGPDLTEVDGKLRQSRLIEEATKLRLL